MATVTVLDRANKLTLLTESYENICSTIGINKGPKIILVEENLKNLGLAGQYNSVSRTISISSHVVSIETEDDELNLKAVIVHELTHFLLYDNGYNEGAHGWPFLALCSLLGYKLGINILYTINENIVNWRKGTTARRWYQHYSIARFLSFTVLGESNLGISGIDPQTLAVRIIQHIPNSTSLFPEKLLWKLHKYYARTDGDVFLLRDSSVVLLLLSGIFMYAQFLAASQTSFIIALIFYFLYRMAIRYDLLFKRGRYFIRRNLMLTSHFLRFLPWNKGRHHNADDFEM